MAFKFAILYKESRRAKNRERNRIKVRWGKYCQETNPYYQWSSSLINLRKRYDELRLNGDNLAESGRFSWLLGPWMSENLGGQQRVLGWKIHNGNPQEKMLVMLNFEGHHVPVDVNFDPGRWVKLGDIENINDLAPVGNKDPFDGDSIIAEEGAFNFILPPYSGFIYKYQPM